MQVPEQCIALLTTIGHASCTRIARSLMHFCVLIWHHALIVVLIIGRDIEIPFVALAKLRPTTHSYYSPKRPIIGETNDRMRKRASWRNVNVPALMLTLSLWFCSCVAYSESSPDGLVGVCSLAYTIRMLRTWEHIPTILYPLGWCASVCGALHMDRTTLLSCKIVMVPSIVFIWMGFKQ